MKTSSTSLKFAALCGAALLMNAAYAGDEPRPASNANAAVVITGWLQANDLSMQDVVLHVEVDGTMRTQGVSENGRFVVSLPADSEVKLRFEKPGHLPKEVLVDTRHADLLEGAGKSRRVKFAVVLELERHMAGYTYAGPVGSLGFDAQGGCLAVSHDRKLEDAPKQKPMVF
ncbi:MAG: hypothetical protein KF905_09950 [Flavobacteriales bacterium]|nr:hypothetical protein [Flavobacteriales bacterium]